MTWYPKKVNTSYHSVRLHVIPLMNSLCTAMFWNICQLFKWSNYVSLFAHYPNSIDKSCPNCRVRINFWIKYQPWHIPIKLTILVIIRRCKWGHLFQICASFYSGQIKFLNWHVILIKVFVIFYNSDIINQLWHLLIKLTSLVIITRCKWGHLFQRCGNFYSGKSKFLNWHVIPIEVSIAF